MSLIGKLKHVSYRFRSRESKFSEIYEKKGFTGEAYPLSGIGSSLEQTKKLREKLPELFKQYDIHSLVDAPCGDFFWMQSVELHDIARNKRRASVFWAEATLELKERNRGRGYHFESEFRRN